MVKPSVEQLASLCPGVEERLIRQHVERLDDAYFERFDLEQVAEHVRGLAGVSAQQPVNVVVAALDDDRVAVTVLGLDYPSEFSLITGVLSGMGLSIESGDVFTYTSRNGEGQPVGGGPVAIGAKRRRLFKGPGRPAAAGLDAAGGEVRRRIIDHFIGRRELTEPFESWAEQLRRQIIRVIAMLAAKENAPAAKQLVNEMVTGRLADVVAPRDAALLPLRIEVDTEPRAFTRLRVVSLDTPAFLYTLGTALSLQGLHIEHVRIRTERNRIEDVIDFVDARRQPIRDEQALTRLKLSVLLTKQFTYFLGQSPDPYTALSRFELFTAHLLRLPDSQQLLDELTNPRTMQDLARLLGASDYLWEEFIRQNFDTLLTLLKPDVEGRRFADPPQTLSAKLREQIAEARDWDAKVRALNRFKDREIFLIDLDHLLTPMVDFRQFAEHLTALAEAVVNAACEIAYEKLSQAHGRPRQSNGDPSAYAVFGLGKLGGFALGYASDIELLFVYDGDGSTDGRSSLGNAEFYDLFVREVTAAIKAKRQGIFEVDLRLRPYGNDGPLACSEGALGEYFGEGGPAHSMERMAMVRLRTIGGDKALGRRITDLRDHLLYEKRLIDLGALRDMRAKQYAEKRRPGVSNAKYSPGSLVDLEYAVQMLQVLHATDDPMTRSPRIHEALRGLAMAGAIADDECARLNWAYDTIRRLINGLRMLRGDAHDLYVPDVAADEYIHLARRIGYAKKHGLTAPQRLHLEYRTATAIVRAFVCRHFGATMLPMPTVGSAADLVLREQTPDELRDKVLQRVGFSDCPTAHDALRRIAGTEQQTAAFAPLALLACDALHDEPTRDAALANWAKMVERLGDRTEHFQLLLRHTSLIAVLLGLLGRSPRIADRLIAEPRLLQWLSQPAQMLDPPNLAAVEKLFGENVDLAD